MSEFGREEIQRYSRQVKFAGWGQEEQEMLSNGRVLILGCGGLGSAAASLLARAGVGQLKLVDRDYMELSNLQRQILYDEHDVKEGLPKVIAAKRKVHEINANVNAEAVIADVNRMNIEKLVENIDVVIDATDNFETRFLLNDACVKHRIPWIYGACIESHGMCMTIIPGKTPCLRCIIERLPDKDAAPTCERVGVLGAIVTIIASIQANEAMKIVAQKNDEINKNIISIDIWNNSYQIVDSISADENKTCSVCRQHKFDFLSGRFGKAYTKIMGQNAVQIIPFEEGKVDLPKLAIELSSLGSVMVNEYLIRFLIDNFELSIFQDGRTIINGTTDTGIARNFYSKYVNQSLEK